MVVSQSPSFDIMNRRNITIEEGSPLITYSPPGAWSDGTSGDPLLGSYSLNSFRLTTTFNATVSFKFNGTSVWVHGARRGNHGLYFASINNSTMQFNGSSVNSDFSTPLFGATNLGSGPHTVTLRNAFTDPNNPFLDIDYLTPKAHKIVVEIPVPDQSYEPVKDFDPSISYSPAVEWKENGCTDVEDYALSTCHSTASNVGTVQFAFQGDAIAVVGGIGPDHGSYNVSIDGIPRGQYSASWSNAHPSQLLYTASGLGRGNHTLKIMNAPVSTGSVLDLDYIQVFGGNATRLGVTSQNIPSQTDPTTKKSSLAGPIAGAVIGALALVAITVVATLFYQRWKRRGVKALDLNQDNTEARIQEVVPDPYVSVSPARTSAYPTYSVDDSYHRSTMATDLVGSTIESDNGTHNGAGTSTIRSPTSSSNEKFAYVPRNIRNGIEPPPYDPGRS
ncbi:hypothetical protein FRB99_006632 [Tulasnella sp. 403]|nr:hypothetical protein FRB99_006632 [Tulasnella sp. 403]